MAKLNDLIVTIGAQTKSFDKALGQSMRKMQTFGKNTRQLGKNLTMGVTAPIAALGYTALKAFDQQAKAIAQVEAGLKSTGGQVGYTSKQLQQMASNLQAKTLFGDEEILQGATAQLLTFTNITGEQFSRTQKAALDLATRLDGDLKGSSIMLGKALNDPIANLSALSRAGIQFSEDQKEVIKTMVETGDLAGAQTVILDELEKQYGGSAEAAAKAGTGGLKQLQNAFGDLQEQFGAIIAEFLPPVIDWLKKMLNAFQSLSPEVKKFMVIGAGIAAAVGPLLVILPTLIQGFVALGTALTGPIGLTIAAIVALGVAIVTFADEIAPYITDVINYFITLYNESDAVRIIVGLIKGTFKAAFTVISTIISNVIDSVKSLASALWKLFTGDFSGAWNELKSGFQKTFDQTVAAAEEVAKTMIESVTSELAKKPYSLVTEGSVAETLRSVFGLMDLLPSFQLTGGAGAGADVPPPVVEGSLKIVDIQVDDPEDEDFDAWLEASIARTKLVKDQIESLASSVSSFIDTAFTQMIDGTATFEQIMKEMLQNLVKQIAIMIAQFVILRALFGGAGVGNLNLSQFVQKGFGMPIGLPKMASGGLFMGASMALVGEGAGTSAINPEVVAPLDKLQSMMGAQTVQVTGRISGRDILITSERNAIDRNRVRGF